VTAGFRNQDSGFRIQVKGFVLICSRAILNYEFLKNGYPRLTELL